VAQFIFTSTLVSAHKYKTRELRFRALVAEGGAERLELTRAGGSTASNPEDRHIHRSAWSSTLAI
jgi:hypothetical protein